jgi:hypothetical protein
MRTVTRNFLLAMGAIVVLLLALGALPGLLKSGDPYYMTATAADESEIPSDGNKTVIESANLSEQRYPYTTTALDNATATQTGQSAPYWRGPVGFKGAFTHSLFDEYNALEQQFPEAADGDSLRVRHNGTLYRVAITQQV